MAGGPPAHNEAVKRARELGLIAERQQRAWDLFTAGATCQQIGTALGVSGKTAWEDLIRVKETLPLVPGHHAVKELLSQRALARLDALNRTHWPHKGDKDSARILLHAWKREAELCGLDAPIKVTATDPTGTRRYHELTEEELARLLGQKAALLGLPATSDVKLGRNGDGPEGSHGNGSPGD